MGGEALESYIWLYSFLPLFIVFIVIIPQQHKLIVMRNIRRKIGGSSMINDLVKKYMGKNCFVLVVSGSGAQGTITAMEDNWIEVSTKKGTKLLNADYITNITEIPSK
jgi:putative transposon-encoded protein